MHDSAVRCRTYPLTAPMAALPSTSAVISSSGPVTDTPLDSAPIKDPKLDEFVEAQAKELNVEKRKQILLDMQKHLLETLYGLPLSLGLDNAPALIHAGFCAAEVAPRVHGG